VRREGSHGALGLPPMLIKEGARLERFFLASLLTRVTPIGLGGPPPLPEPLMLTPIRLSLFKYVGNIVEGTSHSIINGDLGVFLQALFNVGEVLTPIFNQAPSLILTTLPLLVGVHHHLLFLVQDLLSLLLTGFGLPSLRVLIPCSRTLLVIRKYGFPLVLLIWELDLLDLLLVLLVSFLLVIAITISLGPPLHIFILSRPIFVVVERLLRESTLTDGWNHFLFLLRVVSGTIFITFLQSFLRTGQLI